MTASFDLVTFDAPAPDELASFWRAALGLVEVEREDGDRWIVLGDATTRRMGIQRGEVRPGTAHLDLQCRPDEFDDEVVRLVSLGATELRTPRRETYGSIANLADPCGYAFDLCAYA